MKINGQPKSQMTEEEFVQAIEGLVEHGLIELYQVEGEEDVRIHIVKGAEA